MVSLPSPRRTPLAHSVPATHLPGAAQHERPGWQDRLTEKVNEQSRGRNSSPFEIRMSFEMRRLLRLAAEARGIPSGAYARRAIAAFVAADLDLDYAAVCKLLPAIEPVVDGKRVARGERQGPDDGAGYGTWRVWSDAGAPEVEDIARVLWIHDDKPSHSILSRHRRLAAAIVTYLGRARG